jgi:ATP-binding cassette, subfamily C (CFTR/MRP), member 1
MALLIEAVQGIFQTTSCLERIRVYLSSESRPGIQRWEANEKDSYQNLPLPFEICEEALPQSCITFSHVNAGWEAGSPLLKDLNFELVQHQTTMIFGSVASGKSTLLKAILGETPNIEGRITPAHLESAFCNQTPWLTNNSIRDNILGVSVYNQPWYESIIRACDLGKDISQLAHGDQTFIGSKGAVLSGGQQQRVVGPIPAKSRIESSFNIF